MFAALIWLAFIVFPLIDAIGKHEPLLRHGLIIGGAALFVAAYVSMVMTWRGQRSSRLTLALFFVLVSVACALTLAQSSSWGFLFTYCAACAALVAPEGFGAYAVALCSGLAALTSSIAGADGGTVVSYLASSAGIGLLMLVMSDLRLRNQQLSQARAELAEMAVAQERERFARDLHDLLGHSLSVITLKAELAGRLLADRSGDAAAREVAELEQVARTALSEVRDAVSGYRQPTLEGELAGARMALSAAGIEADVQYTRVPLDPAVEAVLAWAVREGATNVIRHSGARHCTVRITASLSDAGVEVIDDGVGETVGANGASHRAVVGGRERVGGHGIEGLAERARLVNGSLDAGAVADGGYRLAVTVPVAHA
jgi:two-component system, NarL family, sensor histidine kinase DesK